MKPINLKELFGDRFKIIIDEAAEGEPGGKTDPWYLVIPCRNGSISPYSDELLAFHCTARGIRTRLHKDHLEIEVRNWSDDGEAIFLFNPDQFDLVANYAKPRRRRQISEKERSRLAKMGRDHRFISNSTAIKATKTAQGGAIAGNSINTKSEAEIGVSGADRPHFGVGGTS